MLLEKDVVAERTRFFGHPLNSGTDSITIDVSALADGQYTLQARGYMGFRFFGRKVESNPIMINKTTTNPAAYPAPVPISNPVAAYPARAPITMPIEVFPQVVKEFTQATFIPGGVNAIDNTTEYHNGEDYTIFVNVTTIETGIVTLAEAESLIQNVKCMEDASVIITFRDVIPPEFLRTMFPNSSMLVIDGERLGSCYLGFDEESENSTYWTDQDTNSTEDGYLVIEKVMLLNGSSKEVQVRGSRASFFFMFEEADMKVEPINFNNTPGNNTDRRLIESSFDLEQVFPEDNSALLKLTTGVRVGALMRCGWAVRFSLRRGIRLSVTFEYELSISPYIGLDIKAGRQSKSYTTDTLISYPILAIPQLGILKVLKVTQPKTGLFIELSLFLEYAMDANVDIQLRAGNTFSTGRKKYEYYINGGWGGLDTGRRTLINQESYVTPFRIDDDVTRFDISASATIFAGLQPGIWLYLFGIAKGGLYQRSGFELDMSAASAGLPAVRVNNGGVVGPCSQCHTFEAACDFVFENLSWEFEARIRVDLWFFEIDERFRKQGTLPGELRFDLLTACGLERSDLIPCSNTCCNLGYKCALGQCQVIDITDVPKPQVLASHGCGGELNLELTNARLFPTGLFVRYQPSGSCTSRTWINVYNDDTNTIIKTFCTDTNRQAPTRLSTVAPSVKFIRMEIWDRVLDERYVSNKVEALDFCIK